MSRAGTRTRAGGTADPGRAARSTGGTGGAGGSRRSVRAGAEASPPTRRRAAATTDDRPGEERRRRRWPWWTLLGVVVVVAVVVGLALSPLLDVESVEVTGVPPERVDAVAGAAGIAVGDPILRIWPSRAAGRVEALAWVKEATVVRDLPGSVRIEVVPRVAVGWAPAGERALMIDADGRVIEKAAAAPPGVPELVGLADLAPVGGLVAPRSLPAAAGALGTELRLRIGTITLEDGALRAQVGFGPELRFGTPDRMVVKARVAAAVLASLGATPTTYVDVSVPAAPVSG